MTDQLRKIRKLLPLNYARIIQERLKGKGIHYSLSHIVKVLIGIRQSDVIVSEAVELAKDHQRAKRLLKKKIDSLTRKS